MSSNHEDPLDQFNWQAPWLLASFASRRLLPSEAGCRQEGTHKTRATLLANLCPSSYEDYLSSFLTPNDVNYLQSEVTARRIVELG